jgi:hypothetical protein
MVRLFLMVAGGLAAPCLALAAFFLSSTGGDDAPARPAAVQAGQVKTPAGSTPTPVPTAVATTPTTVPPAAAVGPLRDPFAPLVAQAAGAGTPAR